MNWVRPQRAVTRSVCPGGVVLSVATAVNTVLCENVAESRSQMFLAFL